LCSLGLATLLTDEVFFHGWPSSNLRAMTIVQLIAQESTPCHHGNLQACAGESSYDCWEKARVDPAAGFSGEQPVRAIFGYGSLIFRPGFPHVRAYKVCVRGFFRRFWQRSCDHRGTVEVPGRVLTLVHAADASNEQLEEAEVHGVAYDVADEDWETVIDLLDIRERHGYVRTVADMFPSEPPGTGDSASTSIGRAVVYYAHEPHANAAYTGPEPTDVTAGVIATARGPSGRNDDYLFRLNKALDSWGTPPDPYLSELTAAVHAAAEARACKEGPSPLAVEA